MPSIAYWVNQKSSICHAVSLIIAILHANNRDIITNISSGLWLPAPAPIIDKEVEINATKPLKLSDNKWQLRLTLNGKNLKEKFCPKRYNSNVWLFTGSYLYSLQIRLRPNVELVKWSLLDIIPEPNEWNGKPGYFVMVNHGLEAPPLELHMEFDVIMPLFKFTFEYHSCSIIIGHSFVQQILFNLFDFYRQKRVTVDHFLILMSLPSIGSSMQRRCLQTYWHECQNGLFQ